MNNAPTPIPFAGLIGVPTDTPIRFERLDLLGWGQTLIFTGSAGDDQQFVLRCEDCRELQWRVYAFGNANGGDDPTATVPTALVGFAQGRDQQRSPMKILTEHFGLTLYYGRMTITTSPR